MRYTLLLMGVAILGSIVPSDSVEAPVRKRADIAPPCWPMFGGGPGRNMVNLAERNLAADWSVEEGQQRNIRWVADIGQRSFSTPVVAEGVVFIGVNKPVRDDQRTVNRSALLAFREADGKLLWENFHDIDGVPAGQQTPTYGLGSTPTVAGRRIFYVTPRCEVICADIDNGKIAWKYDMVKELKIEPGKACVCPAHELGSNICAPLVVDDLVFVVTGNGADMKGNLTAPEAPSFIALHARTGKLAWQSNLPGKNIIEGQWSNPTYAEVKGVPQVIFAGGDCVIYSFAPATGELLWKCDCLPVRKMPGPRGDPDNSLFGTPVVVGDRLYVGLGRHPEAIVGTVSAISCAWTSPRKATCR